MAGGEANSPVHSFFETMLTGHEFWIDAPYNVLGYGVFGDAKHSRTRLDAQVLDDWNSNTTLKQLSRSNMINHHMT